MIRALICDDEELAVVRMQLLLARAGNIDVVGTARTGQEALDKIVALAPDLVLLDIDMPTLDGFDVLEEVARLDSFASVVVLVTAHTEMAAPAFDTAAIDFLQKPVRMPRLERALERVSQTMATRELSARLDSLTRQVSTLQQTEAAPPQANHLWVRRRNERVLLDLDTLDWVEAEREYVRLVYGDQSYLHRASITALYAQLDSARFIRIHRSIIVNRARIQLVRRCASGSYIVTTDNGRDLPVGRTYRREAKRIISDVRPR